MTATIIENDVDTDSLTLLDWKHEPCCEAQYSDGSPGCESPAKFICSVACCLAKILLCEECFFEFIEYAKEHEGETHQCAMCSTSFTLNPGHLKIVGRV